MKISVILLFVIIFLSACEEKKQDVLPVVNNAGQAIYLSGMSAYVKASVPSVVSSISEEFTIESWVYPQVKHDITLFSLGHETFIHFWEYMRPCILIKGLTFDYTGALNKSGRLLINKAFPANEWCHFALTYDANSELLTVYLNGEVFHQCTTTGTISLENFDLKIGGRSKHDYRYYRGQIDEFRIWNVAKTQEEIQARMSAELNGNEEGLMAYWNFNELIIDTIFPDKSQNGQDAETVGDVRTNDSFAF